MSSCRGCAQVTETFLPLIDPTTGRVVNVGSGSGPGYVKNCGFLCKALRMPDSARMHPRALLRLCLRLRLRLRLRLLIRLRLRWHLIAHL